MKNHICFILVLTVSIMIQSCSNDEEYFGFEQKEKTNFPEHIEKYAKEVAKGINVAVQNLNEMGVDYSDAESTPAFKERFYKDWYEANPIMTKSGVPISQMQIDPTVFTEKIRNLTEIQVEFVERIIKECKESVSYNDIINKLTNINKDIYSIVPKIQQDRLLTITAVLYYGINEINNLEKSGLMLRTPGNSIELSRIKTRSESEGSFGDSCRKFLATVWTIAIYEPTPAGEIVASVATIFVAGVLMYEVVVCAKRHIDGDYEYCQSEFRRCIPSFYDACSHCLGFCLDYGYWPGSTKGCY